MILFLIKKIPRCYQHRGTCKNVLPARSTSSTLEPTRADYLFIISALLKK
nr:MAG TPA: hypothetical protein [Caudoviricetes sp.]